MSLIYLPPSGPGIPDGIEHLDRPSRVSRTDFLYTEYLPVGTRGQDLAFDFFSELKIPPAHQRIMLGLLTPLKDHHYPTWEHSCRVAIAARAIAKFCGEDEKLAFMAAMLHDIGKCRVPLALLEKTSGFGADDRRVMSEHVMFSYEMIKGIFDFSAEVVVRHHQHQPEPYPRKLPPLLHNYKGLAPGKIEIHGRILAIADCYDALHRINDYRTGVLSALSGTEIRETMQKWNKDLKGLIGLLYENGVFTEEVRLPGSSGAVLS